MTDSYFERVITQRLTILILCREFIDFLIRNWEEKDASKAGLLLPARAAVEVIGSVVKSKGKAIEVRKMYLLPTVRGLGLGKYLLQKLEQAIAARDFQQIWIETVSVLIEAVTLYKTSHYQKATGAETTRCVGKVLRRRITSIPNSSLPIQLTYLLAKEIQGTSFS